MMSAIGRYMAERAAAWHAIAEGVRTNNAQLVRAGGEQNTRAAAELRAATAQR